MPINQIEKLNKIHLNQLNQEYYFQALFQEVCENKLLSPERIEKIQLELIELLGKEVERYTNGESSSVPVEKAQQILQSVTYCIGHYLKAYSDLDEVLNALRIEKITAMFYKGMDSISELKAVTEMLLNDLQKNILKISNYSYIDTISSGLSKFFHDYNIEFGAFEIPADIDYQLYAPLTHLLGVEYMHEYLHRLTMENNFLKHFSDQKIGLLLDGFHKDSEHMLINIFELVLTNVLGCNLLNLNIEELDIPEKDLGWFYNRLIQLNKAELVNKLEEAMDQIKEELSLDCDTTAYAKIMFPQFADRIQSNLKTNTLKEIFISFAGGIEQREIFIDGDPMEDERLRALIEELKELHAVADKMNRIRETVRSTADMSELLEECFYDRDYEEVFKFLNENERGVLISRILEEAGPEAGDGYIPDKDWERVLLRLYPI